MNSKKQYTHNLIIQTPLFFTGYGNVGWNLSYALDQLLDVSLYPIVSTIDKQNPNFGSHLPNDQKLACQKMINTTFDKYSKCLKIWHQFDLAERVGTGEYIAFPFFELDKFNTREVQHLNIPHKLIVSCGWARDVLINNGVNTTINIVHPGVDLNIFDHNMNNQYDRTNKPFVFLNVGKWEIRKGHDILLELFESAFTAQDNVELWIAASSSTTCFTESEIMEWHNYYVSSKLKDKIKIIPRLETQQQLATCMSHADCGIFPSRAEGWNLDMLEMMAMNKPIITTNYSAHTEFCNPDNSFLVDIESTESAYDGKWFFNQGHWASIKNTQKECFISHMRHVYNSNIRTNIHGLETANSLSWQNSAKMAIRCIYA